MLTKNRRRLGRSNSISTTSFNSFLSISDVDTKEQLARKCHKPHYSNTHPGKVEVLSVDDDPINQAISNVKLKLNI